MSLRPYRKVHRTGTTILEVLFATGIAISGLLGVASLLLMAGRQASVANKSTVSQALSQGWYAEFVTRGLHQPINWVRFQDYDYPVPNTVGPYLAGKLMPGVGDRQTYSSGSQPPLNVLPNGKFSICIDPAFFSDRSIRSTLAGYTQPNLGAKHWYRPAVFPYFQNGHNPLSDPDFEISASSGIAWTDQPRMLRVSVASVPGTLATLSEKQVQELFASQDEITMLGDAEIKALAPLNTFPVPPMRRFQTLDDVAYKGSVDGKFSWLATMSPSEGTSSASERYYTLSLVVIHQRDRFFQIVPRTAGSLPAPDQKPQGESLTWVVPMSGNFVGGNGGRVQLRSSVGVDSSVSVGDWIMLSKHIAATQISASPVIYKPFSAFRWYRVIAADNEPIEVTPASAGSDLYGNAPPENIMTQNVVLEGPDWAFFTAGAESVPVIAPGVGQVATLITPTTATLVRGAVSVYERVIEVPDVADF